MLPPIVTYWHDHVQAPNSRTLLFLNLHRHKPPSLWLWDPTQRFQITISKDFDAATLFYLRLIVDFALIDYCVVKRYKVSQISQRVTHKSSKRLKDIARVSFLYVKKLEWNLKCFHELRPGLKICRISVPMISIGRA